MKNKFLLTVVLAFFAGTSFTHAQEVLLGNGDAGKPANKPADELKIPKYGYNRTHYSDFTLCADIPIYHPGYKDFKVQWWNTYNLGFAYRYKLKLNGLLSITTDIGYKYHKYSLDTKAKLAFPDTAIFSIPTPQHIWQRFDLHTIPVSLGLRFNLNPKRGDVVGSYIELGVSEFCILQGDYVIQDKTFNATTTKYKIKNLPYFNPWQTDFYVRYSMGGSSSFVIRYRYTDIMKQQYGYAKFINANLGIEMNIPTKF